MLIVLKNKDTLIHLSSQVNESDHRSSQIWSTDKILQES